MATYTITGIDDTGATDVTPGLLAFIAAVPDGTVGNPNTIVFGVDKHYRCDGTITILDRNYLDFVGNGSTIETDLVSPTGVQSYRYHWSMERCNNINITGLGIRGPHATGGNSEGTYVRIYEFEAAWSLWSCHDVVMDDVRGTNIYGDCVYLGIRGAGVNQNIEIKNSYFGENGRQGFGVVGCDGFELHHCTTGGIARSLMDFEPNGTTFTSNNCWVHDNTFGRQRLSFVASGGYPGRVTNITVEDNEHEGQLLVTVKPTGYGLRENWKIKNNTYTGVSPYGSNSGRPVSFWKTVDVEVTGNYQPLQAGRNMYVAKFFDCEGIVCENNVYPGGIGEYLIENTDVGPEEDPTSDIVTTNSPFIVGTDTSLANSNTTLRLDLPAGCVAGDEAVAFVGHMGTDFSDLIDTGWTIRATNVLLPLNIQPAWFVLAHRTLTAAEIATGYFNFVMHEASLTFRTTGILTVVRGAVSPEEETAVVSPAYLVETMDNEANSSEVDLPGAITPVRGCLVLWFAAQRQGNGTFTAPVGTDNFVTIKSNSTAGVAMGMATKVYAGAGQGKMRSFASTILGVDYGVTVAFQGDVKPTVFLIRKTP